jgi:flagellum-specific peptidoglycan hydrolase FlgJ
MPNISDPDYLAKTTYIHRFQDIAIAEMKKYHIPASIILAQGILETRAGHSQLALKNNNHFGIKCFSKTCKKGHCSNFTDDSHKDFFVIYKTAWESYRAHSILLVSPKYKHLQVYEKDYKKWATGLQTAGYATAKNYAQSLIQLIEQYNLHKYDFL